jgi:hypothetical protein
LILMVLVIVSLRSTIQVSGVPATVITLREDLGFMFASNLQVEAERIRSSQVVESLVTPVHSSFLCTRHSCAFFLLATLKSLSI